MNYTTQSPSESAPIRGEASLPTRTQLYGLLSSDTRRHLLDILADTPSQRDLRELARAVVDRLDIEDSFDDAAHTVAIELHHNHLPRLENAGLIRYNYDSSRIESIHPAVSERRVGASI